MSEFFPEPKSLGGSVKFESDLSCYAMKVDFKNATGVDISKFAKRNCFANLKYDVDQLDIVKLKNISTNSSNLKSIPVDKKKNDHVKKDICSPKIKYIEDKIPDITNVATKTSLNAKINEVKCEIPSIISLATTSAYTAVDNKIPSVSTSVKKLTITQTLMRLKKNLQNIIVVNMVLF